MYVYSHSHVDIAQYPRFISQRKEEDNKKIFT